jgi:hypothetical protein
MLFAPLSNVLAAPYVTSARSRWRTWITGLVDDAAEEGAPEEDDISFERGTFLGRQRDVEGQ